MMTVMILLLTSVVGVESFATRVQEMLIDYIRTKYGDEFVNSCCDFWTGDRGSIRLAHSSQQQHGRGSLLAVDQGYLQWSGVTRSDFWCPVHVHLKRARGGAHATPA